MNNSNKGEYGQAEVLAHIVRRNRRFKIERRSRAYIEIKTRSALYAKKDHELTEDLLESKRKSNFDLLKRGSISPQKARVDSNSALVQAQNQGIQGKDLYAWDDEDRENCEAQAFKLINLSTQMKTIVFKASKISDITAKKNFIDSERQTNMLKEVMNFESKYF
jgi:hypothetical protein